MRILIKSLAPALAAGALLASATLGSAQGWPERAITLIVPYPPGGSTDIVGRVVGDKLSEALGQPVVIENRPGAGGNLGMEGAATAPADGYTLVVATTAHAINDTLFDNLNYNLEEDLAPIALLTENPLMVVVNPAVKAETLPDLIALAKAEPGSLNYASSGNGQSTHLAAELLNTMAGTEMTHIPYPGSAPAVGDVIAGHVDLMIDTMLSALPHVEAGSLRGLAVTSAERSPAAPDVPTVAESGLPGYQAIAWNGVMAPAGTPPEIVARLNEEVVRILALPDVKARFDELGAMTRPTTPEEFTAYTRDEIAKWGEVVEQSGATVQ